MLRTKMTEVSTENNRLEREIETANEENNSYLSYEKRWEAVFFEIYAMSASSWEWKYPRVGFVSFKLAQTSIDQPSMQTCQLS